MVKKHLVFAKKNGCINDLRTLQVTKTIVNYVTEASYFSLTGNHMVHIQTIV